MADRNLVGRCGLYCGACSIYRAQRDDGEYLKRVAAFFKCPPEKVKCEGCMALADDSWRHDCRIVQCLRQKGIDFCYQCPEYIDRSCSRFEELAKGYLTDDQVDIRANLERIKKGGTVEWLLECETKYRCPSCGRPLSLGSRTKRCYHCRADLSG